MNGSRSSRATPAKARRTGKPSPSKPRGAVVIERTGRRTACGVMAVMRGSARVLETVTAGIEVHQVQRHGRPPNSFARLAEAERMGNRVRGAEDGGQIVALHRGHGHG